MHHAASPDPRPARLAALRAAMQQEQLVAWIVPSADPHLSEYLPQHWQTRVWLSGFDGSAGTLLVTPQHAGLWADSRYWEQAGAQLQGSGIALYKLTSPQNSHVHWLAQHLLHEHGMPQHQRPPLRVGVAADVLSLQELARLEQALHASGAQVVPMADIAAALWEDRPPLPQQPVYARKPEFVATSTASKLAQVRQRMAEQGADALLLSDVADIAWLTNLRGSDVPYNPVFLAHLCVTAGEATLWADMDNTAGHPGAPTASAPPRFAPELVQQLAADGIQLRPYASTVSDIGRLPKHTRLLLDPAKTAVGTLAHLHADVQRLENISPAAALKSCKTADELAHIRLAMRHDGVALCQFFADLEQRLHRHERLTELDIDTLLTAARARQPHFVSPSFATIAGFNANGALPHYRATAQQHATLQGDGLLLLDSGGQYHCGTTDITRVIAIGTASAAQRRDFTLVLKSHIAMSRACFPEGTAAPLLDAIARAPLWAQHMDYGHGTGHGVGDFLNVHEGPQVLSYHTPPLPRTAMRAGMLTSIEPGLYRSGQWGIRIENLAASLPVEHPQETAFGNYLHFETLTLCPIDTRLVLPDLLDAAERHWLNAYHQHVCQQLRPHLSGDARHWLEARTQAL